MEGKMVIRFLILGLGLTVGLNQIHYAHASRDSKESEDVQQGTSLPHSTTSFYKDSSESIQPFLTYLNTHKNKSWVDISLAIASPQGQSSSNRSGRPTQGKSDVNKTTWPSAEAIKLFATSPNHCADTQAGIIKREYLWGQLQRIYKRDLEEFENQSVPRSPQ